MTKFKYCFYADKNSITKSLFTLPQIQTHLFQTLNALVIAKRIGDISNDFCNFNRCQLGLRGHFAIVKLPVHHNQTLLSVLDNAGQLVFIFTEVICLLQTWN